MKRPSLQERVSKFTPKELLQFYCPENDWKEKFSNVDVRFAANAPVIRSRCRQNNSTTRSEFATTATRSQPPNWRTTKRRQTSSTPRRKTSSTTLKSTPILALRRRVNEEGLKKTWLCYSRESRICFWVEFRRRKKLFYFRSPLSKKVFVIKLFLFFIDDFPSFR